MTYIPLQPQRGGIKPRAIHDSNQDWTKTWDRATYVELLPEGEWWAMTHDKPNHSPTHQRLRRAPEIALQASQNQTPYVFYCELNHASDNAIRRRDQTGSGATRLRPSGDVRHSGTTVNHVAIADRMAGLSPPENNRVIASNAKPAVSPY